jgi:serine protease AprX
LRTDGERQSGASIEPDAAALLAANVPGWSPERAVCAPCAARLAAAVDYVRERFPRFGLAGRAILPLAVRLGVGARYAGRGVTLAFLDSGFYAHPDLVFPKDRIVRYVDLTHAAASRAALAEPDPSSWHGMMTSVVACGNGWLSGGLYSGLASEARVVLVKCGSEQRISHDDLQRGLTWVLRNQHRYGIRIVNVSAGGDYEASYLVDPLSRAAERAARRGLLVVAAVGNRGEPDHPVLPPASAPSALAVGGLDDKNSLAFSGFEMYHSSYGPTVDGLQKPEVIAPGIWVAAPLLPGTPTARLAEALARLAGAGDEELPGMLAEYAGLDPALDAVAGDDLQAVRRVVQDRVEQESLISEAYKHVDGTSFAAPIVSAVAAQMLEANPRLEPRDVKRLIVKTARRLVGVDADRQGWGVVDPEAAVLAAVAAAPPGEREPALAS